MCDKCGCKTYGIGCDCRRGEPELVGCRVSYLLDDIGEQRTCGLGGGDHVTISVLTRVRVTKTIAKTLTSGITDHLDNKCFYIIEQVEEEGVFLAVGRYDNVYYLARGWYEA